MSWWPSWSPFQPEPIIWCTPCPTIESIMLICPASVSACSTQLLTTCDDMPSSCLVCWFSALICRCQSLEVGLMPSACAVGDIRSDIRMSPVVSTNAHS